jgi:hypothetical protein
VLVVSHSSRVRRYPEITKQGKNEKHRDTIELLPSPLTEWLVPYAQTTAHNCFALFAFKGKNARHGKAIALDVHSKPGGLKEARRVCGNPTMHALFIHSKDSILLRRSYITASLHSNTITRCLLQEITRCVSSLPHITLKMRNREWVYTEKYRISRLQ